MALKDKFYVVWVGASPGIYKSWNECHQQIDGWKGAVYKSFETLQEAEAAFADIPDRYFGQKVTARHEPRLRKQKNNETFVRPQCVPASALAVDAACSGNPGMMEYRGVYLADMSQVFHYGPVYGTNNIGEFLAIVHGLSLLNKKGLDWPVYSDSVNAIKWVKSGRCKTRLERNEMTEGLFQVIERAELWLSRNKYVNKVLKWDTSMFGEIPADFGRK